MNYKQRVFASTFKARMVSTASGLLLAAMAFTPCLAAQEGANLNKTLDSSRLRQAMVRLRQGEMITVAALGGSITTGYAAARPAQDGWAALVANWWRAKAAETGGTILFVDAGVSGTDSAFGAVRVADQVLSRNADVVFVEFAVNDQWLEKDVRERSYEGVVRRLLAASPRAVVPVLLNERIDKRLERVAAEAGIATHYRLPSVGWSAYLASRGELVSDLYFTGQETIHPNDAGHASIAAAVIELLEAVWTDSATAAKIDIDLKLPKALYGDDFQFARLLGSGDIGPIANAGWTSGSPVHDEWRRHGGEKQGWTSTDDSGEIAFRVRGASVGLAYAESDQYRNAEAWIEYPDGSLGKKIALNCYVSYRTGYLGWAYREIAVGLADADHILHIRVKKSRATDKGKPANIIGIVLTGASQ